MTLNRDENIINIVLVEPEIPQNTGNVARTCAATGAHLHLVEPLGFELSDRTVKRAGLDYWHLLKIFRYKNMDEFFEKNIGEYFYFSTKATKLYTEVSYKKGCYLIFGKETKGLPEELVFGNLDHAVKLPMRAEARSLNLANTVCVATYEALRQIGF